MNLEAVKVEKGGQWTQVFCSNMDTLNLLTRDGIKNRTHMPSSRRWVEAFPLTESNRREEDHMKAY